ncbi:MAG: DHH family phosphoesterase, partial [Chloroflexota bacterium]
MIIPKKWQTSRLISSEADSALHGYPPILRQILFNRGYITHDDARKFLEAKAPFNTDPFQLKDIIKAVECIQTALEKNERIAIYGDYDADGVTATALLSGYLKELHADVISYIPDRFSEGYGLNESAIRYLKDKKVNLIITVDCGIRSLDEALFARQQNIDLIITDHHSPGNHLPNAIAVINPKQPDDNYPDKDLAGVGVAYKLAAALDIQFQREDHLADSFLDLVAIGTVADMVPLLKENRYLVRRGLELIRDPRRQGLLSLIGAAGLKAKNITAMDIGFGLGPRINAAGRIGSAIDALALLHTDDVFKAAHLAQELDNKNRERQRLTREIQLAAENMALAGETIPKILFAHD